MTDTITAYIVYDDEELEESLGEGDMVETDDGEYGFILEEYTSNFDFPGGEDPDSDMVEVEASEETPVFIVGLEEGGSSPMTAGDLTKVDRDEVFDEDDPDPEEDLDDIDEEELVADYDEYAKCENPHDLAELCDQLGKPMPKHTEELASPTDVPGVSRTQAGLNPWPRSWRNSDKPARLIALDAYNSMGRSHTGCTRTMRGKVSRYNAFCAAFKDAVLGFTQWRN